MKLIPNTVSGFAILAALITALLTLPACSGHDSGPAAAPLNPKTTPLSEAQPKEGSFSVKENSEKEAHSRDLGRYTSGQADAAIFCKLVDVPNSASGKFIDIEARWTWTNPDKPEQEFYRIHIEAQSPIDIQPGKNNFDFIDAQVRLYKSKKTQVALADFMNLPKEAYGCDITNLERADQKLKGRILCYKSNVYHGYNLRLSFNCKL